MRGGPGWDDSVWATLVSDLDRQLEELKSQAKAEYGRGYEAGFNAGFLKGVGWQEPT